MTIDAVKESLIDYVGAIEKENLSMSDLHVYTNIVRMLQSMCNSDPLEKVYASMANSCICKKEE